MSGFPTSQLAVAVSAPFQAAHPDLVAVIEKMQFEPHTLNRMILEMTENKRSGSEQARLFCSSILKFGRIGCRMKPEAV